MSITALPPTTTPLYERISETKKEEVTRDLSALLGARYVLHTAYDLMLYEYDASIDRCTPDIVVLPASTGDVAAIVKIAACPRGRLRQSPRSGTARIGQFALEQRPESAGVLLCA